MRRLLMTLAVLGVTLMLASPADAGIFRRGPSTRVRVRVRTAPGYPAPSVAVNVNVPQAPQADALGEVNAARAAHGLRPLAADPNLTNAAAANNAHQAAKGLGHHVNPGASQCSAAGCGSPRAAVSIWLNSPPHRAILLNPSATVGGCSVGGNCGTLNVR